MTVVAASLLVVRAKNASNAQEANAALLSEILAVIESLSGYAWPKPRWLTASLADKQPPLPRGVFYLRNPEDLCVKPESLPVISGMYILSHPSFLARVFSENPAEIFAHSDKPM